MKINVLICFALVMFSSTTSETNPTSETYTLINSTNLAKPGCPSRCGDVIVPYPFGINSNCSIGPGFNIHCNTSLEPPKPSIGKDSYNSVKLISDSTLRTSNLVSSRCYLQDGTYSNSYNITVDYIHWPYTLSEVNSFTVIGCDDYAWLISGTESREVSTGCAAICSTPQDVVGDQCSGNGCCQSSIAKDINYYTTQVKSMNDSDNMSYTRSFNPCTYAFVGEENVFKFKGAIDLNDTSLDKKIEATVPIVLEWAIGNLSCTEAQVKDGFACQYSNSKCVNSQRESGGYRCICNEGYEGNPYLSPGCHDIDECKDQEKFPCYGTCFNTAGNYTCKCKRGYSGDAKFPDGCRRNPFHPLVLYLALAIGLLAILLGVTGICFGIRKRKLNKLREKFFEQNGGVILKQKLKAPGTSKELTIYSTDELRKATDNYSEQRIVGRGGSGVVYKGILPDKRVVGIKKSKLVDGTQAEQFVNEVLILTQVIHRNVVKLLGCCLEEEVPVLVYEFISNNTLFYHIHHRPGGMSWLSWDNRLRIAAEAAGALGYLHSQASMPIIHRDVKSTNILLDDNYTTKISDFGASRLVPLDHDQVTTLVQGTLGYLDPQYFNTSQLTDKSDVYSFGVVLAELITGQKPLCTDRSNEEKNLATYFVKSMKENRLYEIVEPQVLREGTLEQIQAVAELVKRCLKLEGDDRPTMKDVAMELEGLRKLTTHPWAEQQTNEESRSLFLEVEQSDLYGVPLIPYSSNEWESYSGSTTQIGFPENKPR
ncbi:hypothetical protein L6452_36815 [Arctium lappa]|uniref:Uncharacterized protein n=1 Tax=Arctium lappa TaxID=4217 RepID=A0ACB8Y5F4_ARCLA|nr:hypothetical protein L6452_36815 [Arctium lappa]